MALMQYVAPPGSPHLRERRRTLSLGCRKVHEISSPLIYTLLGPMIHPRGPCASGKSKPESPALTLVHQISRYGLHHKKEEVSLRNRREISTNILTNTATKKPTRKI